MQKKNDLKKKEINEKKNARTHKCRSLVTWGHYLTTRMLQLFARTHTPLSFASFFVYSFVTFVRQMPNKFIFRLICFQIGNTNKFFIWFWHTNNTRILQQLALPIDEYASQVWDPFTAEKIARVQSIQKHFFCYSHCIKWNGHNDFGSHHINVDCLKHLSSAND